MVAGAEIVITRTVTMEEGVRLESGAVLKPITVAYETYGAPNARRDNVILVCHALSGGAHAAGWHPGASKPGWWDDMIGPGKAFDTRRYCVVSSNVLGSCYGTTGPSWLAPEAGVPYGARFPVVTIGDMVTVQAALLDRLGIGTLLAVAGGSMGGMQALQWAVSCPGRVRSVVALATTPRHSAQQIAFDEVARRAVMGDPAWRGGDYYGRATPDAGLAVARMLGHITYLSDRGMARKFGRAREAGGAPAYSLDREFQVERYLDHQASSFVRRFDANSLIYLTKAMDYCDLAAGHASLADALAPCRAAFLLLSFSSDWLYPPAQLEEVAEAVRAARTGGEPEVAHHVIASDHGHDAFLLEHREQAPIISRFLANVVQ